MTIDEDKKDSWDQQFVAYLEEVDDISSLAYAGILALPEMPRLMRSLRSSEAAVDRAERVAERANRQIHAEFATFHAQALVGMWGALESAVEDLAVTWVREHPGVLSRSELAKVRIPIALLDHELDDRHLLAVREIQRLANADLQKGVGQFDSLLSKIGLSGPVPENVRRELLYAQQARHLIAHRRGRVDKRFMENCSFENATEGHVISIGTARFARIRIAMIAYVALLADRVRVGGGEEAQDDPDYWNERLALSNWEVDGKSTEATQSEHSSAQEQ